MGRVPITLGARRAQPQPDMHQQITREIFWNVLVAVFIYEGMRWYRMVSLGRPGDGLDQPQRRPWLVLRHTAGRSNVIPETRSWLHDACCVGFLGLFIGTTVIFFNDGIAEVAGFFGFPYYLVGTTEIL